MYNCNFCVQLYIFYIWNGLHGGSDGKESACNDADMGSVPGSGRFPGEGNGKALQVFLLGKFHEQRSLAGYSPWVHKVLHTTE